MVSRMRKYPIVTLPGDIIRVSNCEKTHSIRDWWLFPGSVCRASYGDIRRSIVAFLFEKALCSRREWKPPQERTCSHGELSRSWCHLTVVNSREIVARTNHVFSGKKFKI